MNNEHVEKLKDILRASLLEEELSINADDHLADELGLDSIGYVDLTVKIELTFGIVLSNRSIRAAKTFQDLVNLVSKHSANG
ncbi:MAG: acyl carrier protein [Bacteroidota bacterium]